VCSSCAKRGRPTRTEPVRVISTTGPRPQRPAETKSEAEMEVDPDYNVLVKEAREKLGLSQEALGKLINVKPSLIHHVETKKLKPDIILARKLMHQLRINLLVPLEELEGA
jgi:putative transcription factor